MNTTTKGPKGRSISAQATGLGIKMANSDHKSWALPRALEFLHFGLTAKYQLTTALARLRERGDPSADGWVRESLIAHKENNPSPPTSPHPLPSERAVINCGPT